MLSIYVILSPKYGAFICDFILKYLKNKALSYNLVNTTKPNLKVGTNKIDALLCGLEFVKYPYPLSNLITAISSALNNKCPVMSSVLPSIVLNVNYSLIPDYFRFYTNIYFEICLLLVHTAFISSKNIVGIKKDVIRYSKQMWLL